MRAPLPPRPRGNRPARQGRIYPMETIGGGWDARRMPADPIRDACNRLVDEAQRQGIQPQHVDRFLNEIRRH
jgi:hypothetical protein